MKSDNPERKGGDCANPSQRRPELPSIGLYKAECTRDGSPFRAGPLTSLADLEDCTSAWVHWYNTARLMHRLGRRPPAEAEAAYWAAQATVTTDRRQP